MLGVLRGTQRFGVRRVNVHAYIENTVVGPAAFSWQRSAWSVLPGYAFFSRAFARWKSHDVGNGLLTFTTFWSAAYCSRLPFEAPLPVQRSAVDCLYDHDSAICF